MAEMAFALVAQAPDRTPDAPRPDDPAARSGLLRQDLDYLESVITTPHVERLTLASNAPSLGGGPMQEVRR